LLSPILGSAYIHNNAELKDGNKYNKDNIIAILYSFQNNNRGVARDITLNKIIEKGLVTVGKSTIYAVLKVTVKELHLDIKTSLHEVGCESYLKIELI